MNPEEAAMELSAAAVMGIPGFEQYAPPAGYAAVIDRPGRPLAFYGYGSTKTKAMEDVRRQVAGTTPLLRRRILDSIELRPCDAEHMSEIAEMLEAEVIEWL